MRMWIPSVAALMAGVMAVACGQPGEPIAQPGTQPAKPPVMIKGVAYERLATREATEARMLDLLTPMRAKWGAWRIIGSFPFKKQGDLKMVQPVEAELSKMRAGGPGPDLAATFQGLDGKPATWVQIDKKTADTIDFAEYPATEKRSWASAYVYTTVEVQADCVRDVTMGSDDGLRFWLNGKLLVDADEMRGLDAEEHQIRLDLKKGVNHVLAKVSQGQGGWQFQMLPAGDVDELSLQMLEYHLDVDFPKTPEAEYYRTIPLLLPPETVMEVGGLAILPDGRPIACTRRGEVWIVEGAYAEPPQMCKVKLFATGLHEPLGLAVRRETRDGKDVTVVYACQRGEVTCLIDTNGDDRADRYEAFASGWGVSGNYHEFAFGPKFDDQGNAWITLNVGFCDALGKSIVPYRGWSLRYGTAGDMTPVSSGLRSPNGIGFWKDGQAFYLDNQGDFVGTNRLAPMYMNGWNGHPSGLRWRKDYTPEMETPGKNPTLVPATVWFPYRKMGQSAADFLLAAPRDGLAPGKFGPFDGHVFVGDQTLCTVNRVTIEKIGDVYQGACYPFRAGLQCGVNRLAWAPDGTMLVGQTDRGWGSIGRARFGLERIIPTGKTPFEIKEVRIVPGGFDVEFTQDVDEAAATATQSWKALSYTYEYHAQYGSAEMDTKRLDVRKVESISERVVRVTLSEVRSGKMGFVHELSAPGVKNKTGSGLLHQTAYYTVQVVPK